MTCILMENKMETLQELEILSLELSCFNQLIISLEGSNGLKANGYQVSCIHSYTLAMVCS